MPGSVLLDGASRKTLVNRVNSEAAQGGTVEFGQAQTSQYARFTGFVDPGTGSVTLRIRTGINSGTFNVTSTQVCSTVTVVDVVNIGKFTDFGFSAVQSTDTIGIFGDPTR